MSTINHKNPFYYVLYLTDIDNNNGQSYSLMAKRTHPSVDFFTSVTGGQRYRKSLELTNYSVKI